MLMKLQVQIGADPRNTLFINWIEYKEADQPFLYIVGGTIAGAVLLALVVVVVWVCWRRLRSKARSSGDSDRPRTRPVIAPPESSLARYGGHLVPSVNVGGAKRSNYAHRLSNISENDNDDERRYSTSPPDRRSSYLHTRQSAVIYYNSSAFSASRCSSRPSSGLPYLNIDEIRENVHHRNDAWRQQGGKGQMETWFQEAGLRSDDGQQGKKDRPLSQFPEDDLMSSPVPIVSRSGLNSRPNTPSVYPTDTDSGL